MDGGLSLSLQQPKYGTPDGEGRYRDKLPMGNADVAWGEITIAELGRAVRRCGRVESSRPTTSGCDLGVGCWLSVRSCAQRSAAYSSVSTAFPPDHAPTCAGSPRKEVVASVHPEMRIKENQHEF